jgi:hypothetical protein
LAGVSALRACLTHELQRIFGGELFLIFYEVSAQQFSLDGSLCIGKGFYLWVYLSGSDGIHAASLLVVYVTLFRMHIHQKFFW